MNRTIVALMLSAALGSLTGTAALAQVSTPPATPPTYPVATPAPAAPAAAPAVPTTREQAALGQKYDVATYSDWRLRCLHIEGDVDPCELHQLLLDKNGVRTAEFNIFPLNQQGVAAGVTVMTPLETLLTRNVSLAVDAGAPKMYPFAFCTKVGCIAQMGITEDELKGFRAGQGATVTIVPAAAPTQQVPLSLSLKGFTAAYKALTDRPQPAPQN